MQETEIYVYVFQQCFPSLAELYPTPRVCGTTFSQQLPDCLYRPQYYDSSAARVSPTTGLTRFAGAVAATIRDSPKRMFLKLIRLHLSMLMSILSLVACELVGFLLTIPSDPSKEEVVRDWSQEL
ncbi:hypothetical protein AC579_3114 [Pseudocercospora musae]|uniref:Uncharacterized protein n=1 Tax=Pseudocercospora musae TaxID=113226 RepID=A0A139IA23_9PEZI|nr:hypothetical protein AC579_3114 [Pseudocercospora musae]